MKAILLFLTWMPLAFGVPQKRRSCNENLRAVAEPAPVAAPLLRDLMDGRAVFQANLIYDAGNSLAVSFDSRAVKEFEDVDPIIGQALLRAIQKGLVGNSGQNGIKRLRDLHRSTVEVKSMSTPYRMLGCLKQSTLYIKFIFVKRNESATGYLNRYSNLCD